MEDSYEYDEEKTTEESALIGLPSSSAPPAYEDEPPTTTPPVANVQPQPHGGQIEMGHYPQVQGGALPQTWPQGYPMPQVAGQMPTMIAVLDPPPDHPAPHDFFMLALVTTIICGILNLVSLAFGIPAIILAAMSINAKSSKNYPQARQHGRNALILTVLNIIFTLCVALLIIGLTIGFTCANPANSYYSGSCIY